MKYDSPDVIHISDSLIDIFMRLKDYTDKIEKFRDAKDIENEEKY